MQVFNTAIPDVKILEPKVFGDQRGFFMETYQDRTFAELIGANVRFVQDNHSKSAPGILRGLHYQLKHPQGKLVRVTRGEVFDVAVDLRKSSPTFGRWVGVPLSEQNKRMLWVPPGFAHGFYVTSPEGAEFLYKCTDYYMPEFERSLLWSDQMLAINWPITVPPILSQKDKEGKALVDAELYP